MKKFLIVAAVIAVVLFIIDKTVLKDNGLVEKTIQVDQYEKHENPENLPVGLKKDHRAPTFSIKTLAGETVSLEDYKGKKILLNFWATWCPPCKAEMPDMEELYNEYKDEDFVVLAVNATISEKSRKDVESFVNDYQLTFPILLDEKGTVAAEYEILSYPSTYFIDSDGVVRNKIVGALSKELMYKEMIQLP